jgi:hypothetical protein
MGEAAKRIAELAEKLDPKIVEATLGAARMEAFSWLASSVLWFVGAAVSLFWDISWFQSRMMMIGAVSGLEWALALTLLRPLLFAGSMDMA